jgi:hypothetical protein
MKIVIEQPPNIADIRKMFTLQKGTCFTYGDTLYNPDNGPVDKAFIKHEETHTRQQTIPGMTPEKWWKLYLRSEEFRLSQEVEAYQNQYKEQKKHIKDKNTLNRYLQALTSDLSGPMYGSIIPFEVAKQVIKKGEKIPFDLSVVLGTNFMV